MKKVFSFLLPPSSFLAFLFLLIPFSPSHAQSWNMVITMKDGSQQVLPTADIKSMRYQSHSQQQEDKNVDQIIIKELYNGGCMRDDGSSFFQYDKCIIHGVDVVLHRGLVDVAEHLDVGVEGEVACA